MFHSFLGNVADRGTSDQTRQKTRIDLMNFGPPDRDHKVVDAPIKIER